MEHFYQNIPGWFSYEYVYKDIVEQAEGDSLFVEIGSYKGIPICDISQLDTIPKEDKILFIPLAWNFYNEISSRIKKYRISDNDKFLRYFPIMVIQ